MWATTAHDHLILSEERFKLAMAASVRRITHLGRKKFFETKAEIKARETNPYLRRRFSWTSSI